MRATWPGARSGLSAITTAPLFNSMIRVFSLSRAMRLSGFLAAFDEQIGNIRTGEGFHLAAQHRNFLDQPRGNRLVAWICHEKHSLDFHVQSLVHGHHLEFILEVGHGAQAAHDDAGAHFLGEFHLQFLVERHDFDRGASGRQRRRLVAHHLDAFLDRKKRRLGRVGRNADDEMIDELDRALDDIEMTQSDRIEGPRIKADARLARDLDLSSLSHYSPPSPDTSSMRSTETTRSVPSSRKSVTPCVARPATRMLATGTRIVWPWSVISIR